MSDYIEFELQNEDKSSKNNLGKFKTKISAFCIEEHANDWFEIYKNVGDNTIITGSLSIQSYFIKN